ncbi:MAG: HAMP domain-containing protein, partial [Acidobacteriaceae bacterium]|nr:HAMP domain-containing protein [Acidobacteriaceae bacterium]
MPEIEPTRARWKRLTHSISSKLIALLLTSLIVIFSLLGYLNIRLQQEHLEAATLTAAERVSDVIRRSTTYYMLRNDREGLYRTIQTMADEPGMVKVRIIDRDGRITYSTDSSELNRVIDKTGEACYACHAQSQPLARLDRPDRFRIYRNGGGKRVLGIITPIENQPSCSNAACHAHPASQRVLGVLDTNLSLAKADVQLAESDRQTIAYTFAAMLIVAALSWIFIVRVVDKPIKALSEGTQQLSQGELGYQITVHSQDEVGDLARSFNGMSLQLRMANEQILAWAKTLGERVEEKTAELKKAHEHVLLVEKMATVGKMAAVVAHEINNPLAGILTYAKLLRKWIDRGQMKGEKLKEAGECLDLIGGESRRCGDIVRNLLTFSRTAPMNLETVDVNMIVDRAVRLVHHQLELDGIELQLHVDDTLPKVHCDSAQIEQVLLALIMNAIDAMPHGGNLWLRTGMNRAGDKVEVEVRDDGTGISPEVLPHIFEPFQTTKEQGHGVGLGLAISHSIIERHQGRIEVDSQLGKGTAFRFFLPVVVAATEHEFVEAA